MSEEKEINDTNQEEIIDQVNQETAENVEATEEAVKAELSPEEKYNELNDRFLRLYAEFDNFRRRTNKEKIDMIATGNAAILKDMLPIMDDFERAITNNESVEDIASVKEGFVLIYHKMRSILESKGLKSMQAKGEVFDSELHEAIANIPAPSPKEVGKVIEDVEKGYYLNDKVVRFAKVIVGQ